MPGIQRAPHKKLIAWECNADVAAMTAQLLYMHNLLEYPFDTDAFDRTIGQHADMVYQPTGWLELLLNHGFTVKTVGPYDSERLGDIDYYREVLKAEGWSQKAVDGYTDHEPMVQHVKAWQELCHRFPDRCAKEQEPTDWSTVDALLDQEYIVEIGLKTRTPSVSHPILVVEGNGLFYTLYNPNKGVQRKIVDGYFTDKMLQGICGYKLN